MKSTKRTYLNIGFSSIIMIFVMLCLITFSVLSVTTANADYTLTKKVADYTSRYYEANNNAEQRLTDIDNLLQSQYETAASENAYKNQLSSVCNNITGITYTANDYFGTISFSVPITDSQDLSVVIDLEYPTSIDGSFYEISTWESVSNVTTDLSDSTLHLIGSEPEN